MRELSADRVLRERAVELEAASRAEEEYCCYIDGCKHGHEPAVRQSGETLLKAHLIWALDYLGKLLTFSENGAVYFGTVELAGFQMKYEQAKAALASQPSQQTPERIADEILTMLEPKFAKAPMWTVSRDILVAMIAEKLAASPATTRSRPEAQSAQDPLLGTCDNYKVPHPEVPECDNFVAITPPSEPAARCPKCGSEKVGFSSIGSVSHVVHCRDCNARFETDATLQQLAQFFLPSPQAAPAPGRDLRQQEVAKWCASAFGSDHQSSVPMRGLRMLEEAIEAYQSATLGEPSGDVREKAHKLVDYVFDRVAGNLAQECGGVGLTLLALCEAAGISAEVEELREIARVKSKPLEHFRQRNQDKIDAGFDAGAEAKG